jgi:hypothetical protein
MTVRAMSRIEPSQEIMAASRQWLQPVRDALGHEFLAAYLTGSVLTQGFRADRSSVNILVVARHMSGETLDSVARSLIETRKAPHFDPLFLTHRQIQKSVDVFPIEWTEIQESHLLMEGHDVLGELQVPRTYLRLQCEQELRAKAIQLRKAYVLGARHPDRLEPVLKAGSASFATLFRTLIRLAGESPPADQAHVIERVADLYKLKAEALLGAYLVRVTERRHRGAELLSLCRHFLLEVERLVDAIDGMRVA